MKKSLNFTETKGFNVEDRVIWHEEKNVIIGFGIDRDGTVLATLVPQEVYEIEAPENLERHGEKHKNDFFLSHTYRMSVEELKDHQLENLEIKLSFNDNAVSYEEWAELES